MSRFGILLFFFSFFNFGCSENTDETSKGLNGENNTIAGNTSESKVVPEKLSPREYISWVDDKDNGLKVEKMIGEFTYMFQYKPTDYVVIMDIKKDSIGKSELQKKTEEYNGLQYFNFRMSTESGGELLKKNVVDENDYNSRIQYFSFDMQKDIKLIDTKDTLDCVLFHFERVYGLAPYATFLLGFPFTENNGNKTLAYDDKIFDSGTIYLTIQSKNIKNLPSVIVN